jgi:molecular chaperone DnaK (HSP70)
MNTFATLLRQAAARSFSAPTYVLGVDLGFAASAVSEVVWRPGQAGPPEARCVAVEQPTPLGAACDILVPSVVALYSGKVFVGEGARRLRARAPELGLERAKDLFWGVKGDLGGGQGYDRARPGARTPEEVSSHVLRSLMAAARAGGAAVDRAAVTVPASFTADRRRAILAVGRAAGSELTPADLLDEATAALLDYLVASEDDVLVGPGDDHYLVVVDFGGAAAAVTVLRVAWPAAAALPQVEVLASSHCPGLGGSAIDAAVARQVLWPQLLGQNGLTPQALSDADWCAVEPVLTTLAEDLKVGVTMEVNRLEKTGGPRPTDLAQVVKRQPGAYTCRLRDGRTLELARPALNAAEFEALLAPLLGPDTSGDQPQGPPLREALADALAQAGLAAGDVGLALAAGGGSLLPGVPQALAALLPGARLLAYPTAEAAQTAVARGAAYHAWMLAALGQGVVQPPANAATPLAAGGGGAAAPAWFVPRGDLSVEQLLAVEAGVDSHRAVRGSAGAGKTSVMVHRAAHLRDACHIAPDRLRLVTFNLTLKEFTRPALTALGLPHDILTTFDALCLEHFRAHVGTRPPYRDGKLDFDAVRDAVWRATRGPRPAAKPYDALLLDEGQDFNEKDLEILQALAKHVTVAVATGGLQQLHPRGDAKAVLEALGLTRGTAVLLDTFRCSPQVVRLAAALIDDPLERDEFLLQCRASGAGGEAPVLHTAADAQAETARVIEVVRGRQAQGERVAVLLPTNAQIARLARAMQKAGLQVEAPGGAGRRVRLDFTTLLPKILSYHSAKGLTFDTVLLPSLTPAAFEALEVPAARALFVGISRACGWAHLSTVAGQELPELARLVEQGGLRREGEGDGRCPAANRAREGEPAGRPSADAGSQTGEPVPGSARVLGCSS